MKIQNLSSTLSITLIFSIISQIAASIVQSLQSYEKVSLEPGETKTVKLRLTPEELSLLDRDMNVVVEPGIFEILVGSSSADIRLKGQLEVKDGYVLTVNQKK